MVSLEEEIDPLLLDVLQEPPSNYPEMSEHPEEVGPSTTLALDRLELNKVYEVVESQFARQNLTYISARWERRWVWDAATQTWVVKSRWVAREFKAMGPLPRRPLCAGSSPRDGPRD